MFKIGEFAKLTRVPVRTLRYYDDIGILKAAHIEVESGYRYYTGTQLVELNRILALKDLGLSLEQIDRILKDESRIEDLQGMLRLKQLEIEQSIQNEQQRLIRIQTWLEQEKVAPDRYEITVKDVPAQTVAAIQGIASSENDLAMVCENLFQTLSRTLSKNQISCSEAGIVRYLNEDFTDTNIQVEALIPLRGTNPELSQLTVHHLPAMKVASLAFRGNNNQLPGVYQAILQWLDVQSYRIVDNPREIHLQQDNDAVIEVQVPIEAVVH